MVLRAVEPRAVRGAPSVRLVAVEPLGAPHLVLRRPLPDPAAPDLALRRERGRRPLRPSRPR
jgi:hypothetical protein